MLKKAFSVLMAVLFLLNISQQALLMVHFKLNQQTIEEEFCTNKNNPELQCHGNCYLIKELEQSENTDLESISTYKNIDMALISNLEYFVEVPKIIKHRKLLIYKEFYHSEPHLEIFVPPPISNFNYNLL